MFSSLWYTKHNNRTIILCANTDCQTCSKKTRKELDGFESRNLKIHLESTNSPASYVAHLISLSKEQNREEPKMSVWEATNILWHIRQDTQESRLVPISFKKSRADNKEKALCIDTNNISNGDAPLLEISDINNPSSAIFQHSESFTEWLDYLREMETRDTRFFLAQQRTRNRANEIKIIRINDALYRKRKKCPICNKRSRDKGVICSDCFSYWQTNVPEQELVEWIQKKTDFNLPTFTHRGVNNKDADYNIKPRAQDWHPRIFRVRDYVVGLTSFRYSHWLGCLEVDSLWAEDLPGYTPNQSLRNIMISVLSEAYSLTGSYEIAFTQDRRENERTGKIKRNLYFARRNRSESPVPEDIVCLANKYKIRFDQAQKGRISNQEGLQLFWAMLEMPSQLENKIEELEQNGYISKQDLASIVYSGIWSKEEVIWIFENAVRPEAVVLGSDVPESRPYYAESLQYGRASYLANLFRIKILTEMADGHSVEERRDVGCNLEPNGEFWCLSADEGFEIPWLLDGSRKVKKCEKMLLLSMPRPTSKPELDKQWITDNIEKLKKVESKAKIRCLLLSLEFSDLHHGIGISEDIKKISEEAAKNNIYLLFSPYRLDLLDEEVEGRMERARKRRRYASRKEPPVLQIIRVPHKRWDSMDLSYSVEDLLSASRWIEKNVDRRLGRIRFSVNSQCIERIAMQDQENESIAEFDGKDSEELLIALKSISSDLVQATPPTKSYDSRNDIASNNKSDEEIILPFVLPHDMSRFVDRTKGKVKKQLKNLQGGIVILNSPFKRSSHGMTLQRTSSPHNRDSADPSTHVPIIPKMEEPNTNKKIDRTNKLIKDALRNNLPLAVSYIPHEVIPIVLRPLLYYTVQYQNKEEKILFVKRKRTIEERCPPQPIPLKIAYSDGTEGQPFPLFCLRHPDGVHRPSNLFRLDIGAISMRHVELDQIVEGYLLQNMMINRKETSAEQEGYAFRKTMSFLTDIVDLLQDKRVEEITKDVRFKYFKKMLMSNREYAGCELHIYQTGLEPAVIGMYRAVTQFLLERRGELVVVPRLIGQPPKNSSSGSSNVRNIDDMYEKADEWF